jgi:DNA-binding CsgD family transcriptional regulator
MTLAGRDVGAFQSAVLDLHAPRDLSGLEEATPGIFRRAIPCDYFLRTEFGHGSFARFDSPVTLWQDPELVSRALLRRAMSLAPEHPFTEHVLRTGRLEPMRLSDFWTRRQQLASAVHREVYAVLGAGWMLAIPIVRGGRSGAINLTRPFDAPDFSERDREMLRLLTPHFLLALAAAEGASTQLAAEAGALAGLGLTPREREVAGWLSQGRTNHEIASILAMQPRTVEKHVEHILLKLDVENRTAATQAILRLGSMNELAAAPGVRRARDVLRQALLHGRTAPDDGDEAWRRSGAGTSSACRRPCSNSTSRARSTN